MLQPHAKTQQKVIDYINTLPPDAGITVSNIHKVVGGHKSVINKALRKLCLRGIIVFSHSENTNQGGQPVNIYKKESTPEFEFGLIKEGVFADLFIKPYPCDGAKKVRLLTGDSDDTEDDL